MPEIKDSNDLWTSIPTDHSSNKKTNDQQQDDFDDNVVDVEDITDLEDFADSDDSDVEIDVDEYDGVEVETDDNDEDQVNEKDTDETKDEEDQEKQTQDKSKKKYKKFKNSKDTSGSRSEKRIHQLVGKTKTLEEELQKIREENENLKKQSRKNEKTSVDKEREIIQSRVEKAESRLQKAFEEGDKDEFLKAQRELTSSQVELMAINSISREYDTDEDENVEDSSKVKNVQSQTVPKPQQQELPEATSEWVEQNKEWFQTDQTMTLVALSINDQLLKEGFDPTSDEFYQELDKRLVDELPHRFDVDVESNKTTKDGDTKKTPKPKQILGSSSRTLSGDNKNKVRLSQTELQMAKRLGVNPKKFAQRKLELEKSQSNQTWTDVINFV